MTASPLGEKKKRISQVLVGWKDSRTLRERSKEDDTEMKRYGNLYERVASLDNLYLADAKAMRGKRGTSEVVEHIKHQESDLLALHEALKSKAFNTSPYKTFKVFDPKERVISKLPYYPDRIVHHAIMNVLEPIWTKTFTYNTYCCIKGRGIHACMRRVESIVRSFEGRPLYCLKIDIRKFYPSVDHEVMKRLVRRKIKDRDLLWLIDEIIDSTDGLPIGNYLSQYLSNLYLAYFMHYVNETLRVKATEYADDIVFYSDSKEELHSVLDRVREYLRTELHLELKGNEQIFPIATTRHDRRGRALDYVGYKFYRENTLLRKSIKQTFCRKAARLNRRDGITPKAYKMAVSPWLGWAKYSDSKHLLQTIIKKDYYEIIIKQKARSA